MAFPLRLKDGRRGGESAIGESTVFRVISMENDDGLEVGLDGLSGLFQP